MKNMKTHTKSVVRAIRGNKPLCRTVASVSAITFLIISAAPAFADSTSVLGGNAVLTGMARASLDSNGADAAVFSSSSASAVLDWSKFNVGSGQSMSFNGVSTTFFNLVDGPKSQIDGFINGNGNVWVINPAGIAFGASSSVDVGGLFAAAAGNLENAAALRDGTAMMPKFSAFAGEVDATKGTFVADQIALMGGKVTAGGEADFSGAFKVDVGAGDNLIVDDVRGGMVSIDMSQFADAAKDVLDISGLAAGDALVDVVANGNVKATGDIQAGRLQVMAANDVDLAADIMTSMGEVSVASLNKGDITLSGAVDAADAVSIVANDGQVRIEDGASIMSHGMDAGVDISAGLNAAASGSVTIDGHVQSHGYIEVMARDTISVGKGAAVKTDAEDGLVYLQTGMATYAGDELVGVVGGDITVGEDAVVAADGKWGAVNLHAVNGAVVVKGALIADNEGVVDVSTGYAAKGGVCGPETTPDALNNGGDVNIGGSSTIAAQDVWIASRGGEVDVQGSIVGSSYVTLEGDSVTSSGTIDVRQGTLEVYGNRGDINLYDKASGVVYAGDIVLVAEGNVYADNPNNRIGKVTEAKAGPGKILRINLGGGGDDPETVEIGNIVSDTAYLRSEKGTIKVIGDIMAPDQVVLETEDGDIIVMENCTVTATGSGAVVRLNAGRDIVSDGNLVADGGVELSAKKDITVNNEDGITLRSAVSENGSVSVSTKNGDIVIAPEAMVSANGEGGSVVLKAGMVESGEGSVLVGENATLQAQDTILAIAGYGKLKASGALEGEDVPALKSALKAANSLLANSVSSFVEIGDRAMVIAGRLIALEGKVSVISSGTINAANAKLEVVAHDGGINLYTPTEDLTDAGRVIAGRADFVVDGTGDINVNNGDNTIDALGRVKADARADIEINLGDDNGGVVKTITAADLVDHPDYRHAVIEDGTILIVGDITCPDMVYFRSTSGDVVVMEGATVKVEDTGSGARLKVSAGRSVRIDGTLDSDGTVSIAAEGANVGAGITVGENGEVKAGEGASTVAEFSANGFVQIDGTVDSKSSVTVDAARDVGINGSVLAERWTYLGYEDFLGGDVQINGRVKTRGLGVYALGSVGSGEDAEVVASEVNVQSYDGISFSGDMTADIAEISALGDIELGDMTINQRYEFSPGKFVSLGVVSEQGKITVRDGAKIDATRGDSVIRLSAVGADATGTGIDVNGDVTAGQVVLNTSGDLGVGEGAKVTAKAVTAADAAEDAIFAFAGGNVAVKGALNAEKGTVGILANGDVETGSITAGAYRLVDLGEPGIEPLHQAIDVKSQGGKITVGAGQVLKATADTALINLLSATKESGKGGVAVAGDIVSEKGDITLFTQTGSLLVDGKVNAAGDALAANYGGSARIGSGGTLRGGRSAFLESSGGSIGIDGRLLSDDSAFASAKNGSITVNGTVNGKGAAMLDAANGGIAVNGVVRADGLSEGMAILQTSGSGDVVLGRSAEVRGSLGAVVKTEGGDLVQQSAPIVDASNRGYAQSESLRPVIAAKNVILDVKGDVKGDNGGSVTVDGTLVGVVSGDAKIAIGNGHDLVGGTKQDAARVVSGGGFVSVDLSALGENSAMLIGGNLSLYTAGGIGSYTTFKAGGDASISAARFGDTSYLQAGGMLAINNVGQPSHPQIAYFESVNGVEPKINNLPNDTVIFIDGRLAGGNLQIINKFGATEAFPVSTPELKSEQGIFGNPVFLHGDLDVANPMAVGNVDYMLQEIPRLTLASDFPLEVDKSVNTAGLNPKDVYRFGQHTQVAEEKPQPDQEENTDDKASAEDDAEAKVAMR